MTLMLCVSMFGLTGCDTVPAGYVGVKVNLLGTSKGVDTEELGVGRYWLTMNEKLYKFPTFMQNYTWTKGNKYDESMTFQTIEGMTVGADIGISYSIDPKKVTSIFQKYRKGINEITDVYIRNMVRDALVLSASTRAMADVYGVGKAALIKEVENNVRKQVADIGINIEKVYWIGGLRLPTSVTKALDRKLEATQKAQQRENEVAQAKAEADIKIAQARGIAQSKITIAKADAEALTIKGKALKANPQIIEMSAIDKWNGVLPTYTAGDSVPFIKIK